MKKLHRTIISLFFLFAMSCSSVEVANIQSMNDEAATKVMQREEPQKLKRCLDDKWYTVVHNVNVQKAGVLSFLRDYAYGLGLNVMFCNECVIPEDFNYRACNRCFIDIILDIAGMLDMKVSIKDTNVSLSKDVEYIHNYSLKDLPGSYHGRSLTNVSSNFKMDENADAHSVYSENLDYYKEIEENLQSLFQKDDISRYSINKQGGVLTVVAKQKVHKQISDYLMCLSMYLNDEILVQANIVEVSLDKGCSIGIDWSKLHENVKGVFSSSGGIIAQADSCISNLFEALKAEYGEVKSVSNPRILLANNHSGVFKAVENYPYFDYRVDLLDNGKDKLVSSKTASMKNAVVGVTLFVHAVKLDGDRVKLYFKPTVTEISREIEHDGYKYLTADNPEVNVLAQKDANQVVQNKSSVVAPKVPVLRTRELDSTITLNNGQSVVIGGLILEKGLKSSGNIWTVLVSKLTFGRFGSTYKKYRSELVIILKATALSRDVEYDYYQILLDR